MRYEMGRAVLLLQRRCDHRLCILFCGQITFTFNLIALRKVKTHLSFYNSKCDRVKITQIYNYMYLICVFLLPKSYLACLDVYLLCCITSSSKKKSIFYKNRYRRIFLLSSF